MTALLPAVLLLCADLQATDQTPEAPTPAITTEAASTAGADDTLRFADHLFKDGDWYRSITEYRRFLWQQKGVGPDAERAAMAIGEALARGEQWDAAGRQLDGVAQRAGRLELRHEALFAAGRAYLLDGRPELAKPRFRLLVEDGNAMPKLRLQSKWLLAWGHFDAGELEQARAWFQEIVDAKGEHAAAAADIVKAIDARGEVELKDPLLAGVLSLVPGFGHFYLGQWGVGLTSLVWNGLFIFAAISAWLAGDIGVAAVLTIFELGWYSGGIFGAVAGAYRHNRDAVRNWRDDVLATYGQTRELPDLHQVEGAPPGALLRFSGTF
jgi:tetratricopeptide (TPR) repeat protein